MQVPLKYECTYLKYWRGLPSTSVCQMLTNGLCIGIYVGDAGGVAAVKCAEGAACENC